LGVLLLCLLKLCITIAFGSSLVYLFYALNVFEIGWAFLPFMASLLIFGWTVGFLSASAVVYWGHQVEAFAWMLGFIFAPFSGVFYPVDILPAWAQVFSWSLPTTYIFTGMRIILMKGAFPLSYFITSLLLNALYLSLALVLFRYMFEKSRAKGLARLE
jgi:ABC-2 type transport system permease protein